MFITPPKDNFIVNVGLFVVCILLFISLHGAFNKIGRIDQRVVRQSLRINVVEDGKNDLQNKVILLNLKNHKLNTRIINIERVVNMGGLDSPPRPAKSLPGKGL